MKLGRKVTGGKYKAGRKKKSFENRGQSKIVKLGEERKKSRRTRGGDRKTFLLKTKFVNVHEKGKAKKVEIKNVLETPSNKFLARQNVLTKGTIVETELGKVRIMNRPSQEGSVNGVLVK